VSGEFLVLVTVGGDHHPFARVMRWTESWLAARDGRVRCVAQHGTAPPPAGASATPFLPHAELQRLIAEADVVVSSGGPSTMSECLDAGIKPVVVPRRAALGEVVDDHQLDFCRRMAARDRAALAEDEATLHELLDKALADPGTFRSVDPGERRREVARTVATLGALIDDHVRRTRRRRR